MSLTKPIGRPRVFYGWWVVAAGSLVAGIGSVNLMGFTVFFLPLSRELGTSRAITSLVHSTSRLEGGLLGPIAGWAIDRFGPGRVMAFGSVMGGLGLILLGTAVHSVTALFLVYGLLIGIGFNTGFFPAVIAAMNVWFVRRRTVAMGIVNASWGAAAFVLVPTLAFVTLHFSWRAAAVLAGCLILATALPALLVVRRSPESMGLLPDGRARLPARTEARSETTVDTLPDPRDTATDFTVRQALSTPTFWLFGMAVNLRMIAYSAVLVHFAPLLVWKGLSEQGAGNLIGLWSLLVVPSSLAGGYLADRWNKRALIAAATLVGAGAYLLLAFAGTPRYLYLAVILLALFDNVGVMNWSLLGDYFGRKSFGALRGTITGIGSFGVALSPVYAGWVYDRTGSYLFALVPFAGALLVSALTYALLPSIQPRPPGPAPNTAGLG